MKFKIILLILLTGSLALVTGCWDYKEYETLALVSVVGFDTDSSARQVTVTVEYLVPGGSVSQAASGSSKANSSTVVKATGFSIDDALTNIQQATGKKLFFGYMEEIVIGEDAAKRITKDIVGYIDRTPNIRTSAYITITQGKAEKVLSTIDPNASQSSGKNIHNLIEQSLNSGSAFPVTIQDFNERGAISGEESVAPKISVEDVTQSKSSGSPSGSSSEPSGETNGQEAVVLSDLKKGFDKIDGIAAFQQGNLVGWLTGDECTGLGWICNQKNYPYEVVKTSLENNVQNTLVFRVTDSNCDIKIKFENDEPVINISEYAEADLRKLPSNIDNGSLTPDAVSRLEKELAGNVKKEIIDALNKGQKQLKTDVFGIGFDLYRQYPKLWHSKYEKNWAEIFPTLQTSVSVDAKVTNTGTNLKNSPTK
jgi:spore germination protein KC